MQEIDKQVIIKEIASWTKTVILAVAAALFITQFIIVNAKVPTGSMENIIRPNDRIVAFRLSYIRSKPQRFDIVVFHNPDDRTELYVKRVIGLPGETVTIRAGKVYINDNSYPLDDSFVPNKSHEESIDPITVPEDSYYMLGDNRINSLDSRTWLNKFVPKEDILGKVLFRYFPNIGILFSHNERMV
jgi:signal peptidase I